MVAFAIFAITVFTVHQLIIKRLLNIHKPNTLIWTLLITCFIGFYLSGRITRKVELKYTLLLYLQLFVFVVIHKFYFPLNIWLLVVATFALILARSDKTIYKFSSALAALLIIGYYIFEQPLIIEKKGFKIDEQGNFVNALVLWRGKNKTSKLPQLNLYDVDGKAVAINTISKNKTVLTFWATWCDVCRKERPQLEKLKETFKTDGNIVFIDISLDTDEQRWKGYLEKNNPPGIQLISKNIGKDKVSLGISGIPHHIVLNKDMSYRTIPSLDYIKNLLMENQQSFDNFLNSQQ